MAENLSLPKSDLASVLKAEIARLARKELRAELEPFKKAAATSKAQISTLRAEVQALQKQVKSLNKLGKKIAVSEDYKVPTSRHRFTAKGLLALRTKFGISRVQMGQLIGASDQSVRKWEDGDSIPREKYQTAIFELRALGKKEVATRLETL